MALSIKQQMLLDLLIRIDRLMTDNDIQYELFGGSTIGALRHNGFIPWDDDIDIIIDFENYYKLEALFKDGPIDDVNLVFFHNEPNWYRSFAMLVNTTDTCYTVPCMYTNGLAAGTRIDVMICDYCPKDRLEDYRHDLMLYQEILTETLFIDTDIYKIKDEYYELKKQQKEKGKAVQELELRRNLEAYSELPNADQLVVRFWTQELRFYDIDVVFPPLRHDFEGYMMPIPAKPEEQLRLQYGPDWYIVPETDRWESHNFYDNTNFAGNNYHEDLVQFIDQKEGESIAEKRKSVLIDRMAEHKANQAFRSNLSAQREIMRAGFRKEAACKELLDLYASAKYSELYEKLEPLIKNIKDFEAVEPAHKHVPADVMNAWLRTCVYCGKFYKAAKVINAFEIEDDAEYSDGVGMVKQVMALQESFQDRNFDLTRSILGEFSAEDRARTPDCITAEYRLLRDAGDSSISESGLLAECERYLGLMDNVEILKIKGDLLNKAGKTEEAMEIYADVHDRTDNGLDLLELETVYGFDPRFGNLNEEKDSEFSITLV